MLVKIFVYLVFLEKKKNISRSIIIGFLNPHVSKSVFVLKILYWSSSRNLHLKVPAVSLPIHFLLLSNDRSWRRPKNWTFSWRCSMRIRRRILLSCLTGWMTSAQRWNILFTAISFPWTAAREMCCSLSQLLKS